jgi:4-hydroxy-2-oxoheptanedioate aldolase
MLHNKEYHGMWRVIPSMFITEIICQSDYDFQIFDCEHGSYSFESIHNDVRICKSLKSQAYVRVSGLNAVEVQKCLDLGADGIVFPQLSSYQDFYTATKLMNFPSQGKRGFNPFVPAGKYGFDKLNDNSKCIVIIETLEAVKNLDKILSINRIDIIYIGAYDLSSQLNCAGEMRDPKLLELIDEVIVKSLKHSKEVGLIIDGKINYEYYKKLGVSYFVHLVESFQIKKSLKSIIDKIKK